MSIRDIETSWLEQATGALSKTRAAAARVEQHVVPVFHTTEQGLLLAAGTGVLARLGNRCYLVSAAHVLDHCDDGAWIPFPSGTVEPLANAIVKSAPPSGGTREDDKLDVGFVQLTEAETSALGHKRMLDLDIVGGEPLRMATTIFLVIGYPLRDTSFNRRDGVAHSEITHLMLGASEAIAYQRTQLDRRLNLLLDLDRRFIATKKSTGAPPSMRGISGGGVWPVRLDTTDDAETVPFFAGLVIERPARFKSTLAVTLGSALRHFVRRFGDRDAT